MEEVNKSKIVIGIITISSGFIKLLFELLWWHSYQTGMLVVGAVSVFLMIGGSLLIKRGRDTSSESSIMRISSYFSERMGEIQEGTYIPSYTQIKELPEFSGISRRVFRIARDKWFKQNFQKSFFMATSRLEAIKTTNLSENEYDNIQIKRKRNKGKGLIVVGALLLIFALIIIIAGDPVILGAAGGLGYVGPIFISVIGVLCMVLSIPKFLSLKKMSKET
ncbi:MAG: hypothetical protein ACW98X_07375 [Promethearchaeota archaeon]|jgi:hypothetical protein